MAGKRKTNRYNGGQGNQNRMARNLDDLAQFDDFEATILPKLRQMIKNGDSAEAIYKFSQSFLAARAVTIGIQSPDEKAALAAIREVLDRALGKAADKIELTTRYESLTDDALDRMLEQQEAQLGIIQDEDLSH